MRNIKKLILAFVMLFTIVTLVSCSGSQINVVGERFDEAGFSMYEYKNYISANYDLQAYLDLVTDDSTEEVTGTTEVSFEDIDITDRVSTNLMFIPVDRMSLELRLNLLWSYHIIDNSAFNVLGFDEDEYELVAYDEITDLSYDVYTFSYYEETVLTGGSDSVAVVSKTAVIISFESEAYLREVLEVSTVLDTLFASYEEILGSDIDLEDHINGNLLLLIPNNENRLSYYDEIVTLFNETE